MKLKQDPQPKLQQIIIERRLILEMINASIGLAQRKGAHPLTTGCNCIICVNQRKRILAGPPKPWRFRL